MSRLRLLARHRSYAFMAVFSLALAVGANLVVFTIVKAIWLRPQLAAHADRLVAILGDDSNTGTNDSFMTTDRGIDDNIRPSGAFQLVAAEALSGGTMSSMLPQIRFPQVAGDIETLGVTWQYFSVLQIPVRGRDFGPSDDRRGGEPVAIVSERLWRSAFGSRPDVIGSMVQASPVPIRIIGVAPAAFEGARLGQHVDLWIPQTLVPRVSPAAQFGLDAVPTMVVPIARLRDGVTPRDAERMIDAATPPNRRMAAMKVIPLAQVFGAPGGRTIVIRGETGLLVLALTSLLVFAGGCATIVALVLVHYERRRQELSVRLALGASRGQLAAQLARELLSLAGAGAAAAVILTAGALRALPAVNLPGGLDLSRLDLAVDWRVVSVASIAAIVVLGLSAAWPAAKFSRSDLARSLVTTHATDTAGSHRLRRVLLTIHVVATVIVLIAAGLFVRTIELAFHGGPGFDAERTLFVNLQERPAVWASRAQQNAVRASSVSTDQRLLEALRAMPALQNVSLGLAPIGPDRAKDLLRTHTLSVDGIERQVSYVSLVGEPSYLNTIGLKILSGRGLTDADANATPRPVVVTASLAQRLFPDSSPLGRSILFAAGGSDVVIGICDDATFGSFSAPTSQAVISVANLAQWSTGSSLLIALRSDNPAAALDPVRQTIASVFPDAPSIDIATGREIIRRDLARERIGAWFFSGLGVIAFGLGVGSVFGLVGYLAESRRREFGIRMALGATPVEMLRRATRAGLVPVVIGTGLGLIASAWLTRYAASLIYGISRLDPVTYGGVSVVMIGAAAIAGLLAAWRIRRIAPVEALRAE